jgi:hypothetical protein
MISPAYHVASVRVKTLDACPAMHTTISNATFTKAIVEIRVDESKATCKYASATEEMGGS